MFAKPEVYEYLEPEGYLYAIRLPANEVLQREIEPLLGRPVGRSPMALSGHPRTDSAAQAARTGAGGMTAGCCWHFAVPQAIPAVP